MSGNSVTGSDLKRLIKLSRDQPVPFAFNPGKSPAEHYFAMHRKRPAGLLGKEAKKEGPGAKVGFGTAQQVGKVLELTCERAIPMMAKQLRLFLRANKVSLNVRILDADGNVLEDEIDEDLVDEPGDAGIPADADDATGAPADDVDDAVEQPADDPADIVAGLKRLQPGLAAAPQPVADKLKAAMAQIVARIKAGDVASARAAFGKLEAAVAKLGSAAPRDAADTGESPAAPASGDDGIKAMAARAKAAQAAIASAPAPAADKLRTALQMAVTALKGRDIGAAGNALDRIEAALAKLGLQPGAAAPAQDRADKADERPDPKLAALQKQIDDARQRAAAGSGGDLLAAINARLDKAAEALGNGDSDPLRPALDFTAEALRLQSAADGLTPDYARALSTGMVADPQALRVQFESAIEMIAGGNHAKAWANLRGAQDAILAGVEADSSAFMADIAEDVRPFALSRLNWMVARNRLFNEIEKLQAAIVSACGDDPELRDIAARTGRLKDRAEHFDLSLADKLDDVVTADPGPDRDANKAEARKVLREFQSHLQSGFFAEVDKSNGFVDVEAASTVAAALDDIDRVLAA